MAIFLQDVDGKPAENIPHKECGQICCHSLIVCNDLIHHVGKKINDNGTSSLGYMCPKYVAGFPGCHIA